MRRFFCFFSWCSRIAVDRFRVCCIGDVRISGVGRWPHQTHFQGRASAPLPRADAAEVANLRAQETRPCHPVGQAKRRAYSNGASQLVGGSAGGQPRGESTTGRVQNVRRSRSGSNQTVGVRNNGARRPPGSTPHEMVFSSLLRRARPRVAPVRPRDPQTGPAWFVVKASRPLFRPAFFRRPPPSPKLRWWAAEKGWSLSHALPPFADQLTQKRCSSNATFLASTW